jgi:oligosaccharide repeat unit polymerase
MSYFLTQVGFILGFYTFKKRKESLNEVDNKIKKSNITSKNLIAFYFFSFIYLFFQGIIYVTKGIPIFMVSRLETFSDGGGSGILGRITEVSSIFSLYAFFLVIKVDKFRISEFPKYTMIGLIFLTFMLSGSKSSFLTVFYVFWCYIIFTQIKGGNYQIYLSVLNKHIKSIIAVSVVLACLVIYIQSKNFADEADNDLTKNPLVDIAFRFVYSGDIYWFSYPNNVYLSIPSNRGFTALFTDILGLFRIYNWEDLPEVIGLTMKRYHHPSDVITGSNARHNVFGLIYYGFFGSILFSYVLGLFLSFIRNKLPNYLSNTFFGGGVFTYLMIKIAGIDTDPVLTMTNFDNLFFIFPIMFLIYLLLIEFLKLKKQ